MKAENDMTVWSIIERLQRRLERQGLTPAAADRAVAIALRSLATAAATESPLGSLDTLVLLERADLAELRARERRDASGHRRNAPARLRPRAPRRRLRAARARDTRRPNG